jgi:hypothetical protein
MESKDFFSLSSKLVSSTVQASAVGLKIGENNIDDHWNLINGNYKGIDFPVVFKQDDGKKFNDILDTGWPSLYLISERLKDVLEENSLTGWKTFPIKLYDKKGNEISGYHGFSVTGTSGPTIYDNCEIVERRMVPDGPICHYYKGVFIDKWDGTDFFTPDKTGWIFITKKAADVLKKNKVTNLELKNLADHEIAVRYVKKDFE